MINQTLFDAAVSTDRMPIVRGDSLAECFEALDQMGFDCDSYQETYTCEGCYEILGTNNVISVTQSASTGQIGDLTPQASAGVSVTGVEGTGQISQLLVWGNIVPGQDAEWAAIDDSQTPGWSEINDSQTPNWKEVA